MRRGTRPPLLMLVLVLTGCGAGCGSSDEKSAPAHASAGSKHATAGHERSADRAPNTDPSATAVPATQRAEPPSVAIEEGRFLPVDKDGWTVLTRARDARVIYVSSSEGKDTNGGTSPNEPKKTITAAKAMLRHNFPDWMLLRRGDVFDASLGQWKKSGRSAAEPMVIGTYGEGPRPKLRTGTEGGISTMGSGGSPKTVDHVAVIGLHFEASGYDGKSDTMGVALLRGGAHWLFEDVMVEGYYANFSIQGFDGPFYNVVIRRSVIVDAYRLGDDGHSQGLYFQNTHGALLEDNVIDMNGWRASIPEARANIFRHNIYVDNGNTGFIVRGNIVTNGPSHGIQLRSGGVVEGNVFARNAINILVGGGTDPEPGGVTAEVLRNVVLDGKNIDRENPRGWGIELENVREGRVAENIVAGQTLGRMRRAIHVTNAPSREATVHLTANLVYGWGGAIELEGPGRVILENNIVHNAVDRSPLLIVRGDSLSFRSQDNRFFSDKLRPGTWFDVKGQKGGVAMLAGRANDRGSSTDPLEPRRPDASLATYHASLGREPSFEAFVQNARKQRRGNYRKEYTPAAIYTYFVKSFGSAP